MKQFVVLFLTVTLLNATPVSSDDTTTDHNITTILAKHSDFSTFNDYLTVSHLANEINSRQPITVLAIDNAAMSSLLNKTLSESTLKNVLSLHVLVDYFDARKLHQITNGTTLVSSMLGGTVVNVTILQGGRVGFAAKDNDDLHSLFVKSVEEEPDVISILQISQPLSSSVAEAPTASPSQIDFISKMSNQGCKAFADLLRVSKALSTFTDNVDNGLTVFCPTDSAVNGFIPKYENLTEAKRVSLLLYHGVPVYQSLKQLKSSKGVVNTLATEGDNKYDFTVQNDEEDDEEEVKLETKVNTANIVGTLIDQDPFVAYKISQVLMPRALFEGVVEDDTAPPFESPPKPAKKKKGDSDADSPADGPGSDEEADDQEADEDDDDDDNGVSGLNNGYKFIMVLFSLFIGILVL